MFIVYVTMATWSRPITESCKRTHKHIMDGNRGDNDDTRIGLVNYTQMFITKNYLGLKK